MSLVHHLRWGRTRGWSASPANVSAPGNGVELKVVALHLACLRIDLEVIDALDRIDASAELRNVPAPGDLGTIMEDVQGGKAGDWWGVDQGRDVVLLACE